MASLADVKKKIKAALSDYSQLVEKGSPLESDYQNLKKRVSRHIPSNEDFRSPQSMSEWAQAAALNAPMLGVVGKLPKTKFSEAHDIAQRNAALPVEQGGLGLPANNTAMDRARALGFDTEAYHGTARAPEGIESFDFSKGRKSSGNRDGLIGTFSTNEPNVASDFADFAGYMQSSNVMPLMLKKGKEWNPNKYSEISDLIDKHTKFASSSIYGDSKYPLRMVQDVIDGPAARKELLDQGFDSIALRNTMTDSFDGVTPIDQYVSLKPENIRSKFAAFDPMKKDSADILATLAGLGVVSKALSGDEAEANEGNKMNSIADYREMARKAEVKYGLPMGLVSSVIEAESGYKPRARSPKGAAGIAQFMPATAKEYGVDVNDPASSIDGSARMLADLYQKYNGDQYKTLAGYNWGQGNVDRKGIENAPRETRDYNSKINRLMNPMGTAYASEEPDTSGWVDVTDEPDSQATVKQSLSVDEPDTSGWVDVTDEPEAPEAPEPAQVQQGQPGFMTQMQQQALKTLGHKSQVAGRGIIEGIAGIPESIYNTAQIIPRYLQDKAGYKPPIEAPRQISTEQYGTALADKLGLDKATENDAILYPVAKATGGFAIPAAGYSKVKTGAGIIGGVAKQLPGMMAGQGSSEIVKQMGGGEGAQMAANIAGNVAGSYALPVTAGVTRTTGRGLASLAGANMEAVAGRALNRAAGVEAPYVADILATGKVPTVKIPIKGYKPNSSEVGGNPGIATVLRNQKMSADNLTDLGNREYQNMAAVKGYAEKAVGDTAKIKALQAETRALTDSALKPMRANNKPVDVSELKKSLDDAIAYHEGNDEIVKHLKTYRNRFDDADTMPFSKVVNIKQSLFEKMHADKFTDPEVASLQRAKSAFEEFNAKAIDKLTDVEPGYRAYAIDMGHLMRKIEQGKAAQKVVKKATGLPVVSNIGGQQVELKPIMSGVLNNALKADSITKLNPTQIKRLSIAQEHAGLRSRTQAGSLVGSNTAQNEAVKDSLLNDAIQGMEAKKGGGIAASLGNLAANYTKSDTALKAAGLIHGNKLSAILTKAELNPKYAAELMKKYGLGHMNFNDPAGRAALRGMMQNRGQQ